MTQLALQIAAIAAAGSVEQAVELIRSSAKALVGCDGIAVIRKDGEFCHYVEEDAIGSLWKGQKFPMSACVSGWAMIHRETVVISDIHTDPRIPIELYLGTFVKSLAMAPIDADNPVGAIGAYWSVPFTPTPRQLVVLESLANAAASPMAASLE